MVGGVRLNDEALCSLVGEGLCSLVGASLGCTTLSGGCEVLGAVAAWEEEPGTGSPLWSPLYEDQHTAFSLVRE